MVRAPLVSVNGTSVQTQTAGYMGVTDRGNSRPRQPPEAVPSNQPPPPEGGAATSLLRPLSEMTQFRTRQGNLMLYALQPMDSWIGKEVLEDESNGGYRDAATGKATFQKASRVVHGPSAKGTRDAAIRGDMVDKLPAFGGQIPTESVC